PHLRARERRDFRVAELRQYVRNDGGLRVTRLLAGGGEVVEVVRHRPPDREPPRRPALSTAGQFGGLLPRLLVRQHADAVRRLPPVVVCEPYRLHAVSTGMPTAQQPAARPVVRPALPA